MDIFNSNNHWARCVERAGELYLPSCSFLRHDALNPLGWALWVVLDVVTCNWIGYSWGNMSSNIGKSSGPEVFPELSQFVIPVIDELPVHNFKVKDKVWFYSHNVVRIRVVNYVISVLHPVCFTTALIRQNKHYSTKLVMSHHVWWAALHTCSPPSALRSKVISMNLPVL